MNDHGSMGIEELIDALIESVGIAERFDAAPIGSPSGSRAYEEASRARSLVLQYRAELLRRLY